MLLLPLGAADHHDYVSYSLHKHTRVLMVGYLFWFTSPEALDVLYVCDLYTKMPLVCLRWPPPAHNEASQSDNPERRAGKRPSEFPVKNKGF